MVQAKIFQNYITAYLAQQIPLSSHLIVEQKHPPPQVQLAFSPDDGGSIIFGAENISTYCALGFSSYVDAIFLTSIAGARKNDIYQDLCRQDQIEKSLEKHLRIPHTELTQTLMSDLSPLEQQVF